MNDQPMYPPPGEPQRPDAARHVVEHLQAGGGAPAPYQPDERPGGGRRKALVIGGTVTAAVLVGGGVWAWNAWFSQGPQPSEALPDSTLAYVSVDLDPPGKQKVEAIETLRKFPSFRDSINLHTDDDIRKKLFEAVQDAGACPDLDYGDDIEPWLGNRAAFALVDQGKDDPAPVAVVQVTDQDKAEDGLKKLTDCASAETGSEDELGGYAFNGDWVVIAQSKGIAEDVVDAAGDGTLADDGDYQKWTQAVGDPGIVTMYAAPAAGEALLETMDRMDNGSFFGGGYAMGMQPEQLESGTSTFPSESASEVPGTAPSGQVQGARPAPTRTPTPNPSNVPTDGSSQSPNDLPSDFPTDLPSDFPTELPSDFPTDLPSDFPTDLPTDEPTYDGGEDDPDTSSVPEQTREMLKDFPGGAGVIRFADGDLEMEFAVGEFDSAVTQAFSTDAGGDVIETLPDSTAVAYGLGFSDGWLQALIDEFGPAIEQDTGMSVDEAIAEAEKESGISIPDDIETLAGRSIAVSLDAEFDTDAVEHGPDGLPAGAKIKGDPEEIEKVLDKIRATMPADERKYLVSRQEDGYVLVGTNDAYLDLLASKGNLGSSDTYRSVIPESEDSSAVFYLNFDAGGGDGWLADLVSEFDSKETTDNVKPLEAIGMSAWTVDGETHSLLRLTTED